MTCIAPAWRAQLLKRPIRADTEDLEPWRRDIDPAPGTL